MARFLGDTNDFFLHIPRTGGSWIQKALDASKIRTFLWNSRRPSQIAMKHFLLGHIEYDSLAKLNRVFTFVRHPISYYESVWGWMMESKGSRNNWRILKRYDWHPHLAAINSFHPDFNAWLQSLLDKEPCWYTRLVEQYVGPQGGEFCDYIGRTETLTSDFFRILEWLGYSEQVVKHRDEVEKLGRINPSIRKPEWETSLVERVVHEERRVVKRFYGADEHRRFYGSRTL